MMGKNERQKLFSKHFLSQIRKENSLKWWNSPSLVIFDGFEEILTTYECITTYFFGSPCSFIYINCGHSFPLWLIN